MLKICFSLLLIIIVGAGCLKEQKCSFSSNNIMAPVSEKDSLQAYITANNIQATRDTSGLFYSISNPGTGTAKPVLCSQITINYAGKLTNGTIFDQSSGAVFQLGTLIEGWKKGIPLLGKGGQIRLYIPPTLGYGSTDVKDRNGVVVIPGKSILIFDITLIDFTAG
ncbi:MAG: FKBP-type peptidyl-prolyl cis-trans isomerase [Flavitalea sp.]